MARNTSDDDLGGCRELLMDELNAIAGGNGKAPAPAAKTSSGLFEIEDYSFDIEQVLNIGSH
jgi:hypothetical protein